MTQQLPVARSMNYFSFALQILFLIALYLGFEKSGSDEASLWAGMVYLVLAYSLRYFVPIDHRKGVRELKQGKYEEALVSFQKSFDFFTKHPWIDRFRVFTTFSVSKLCYRETAMVNKAFALICLDRKEEAKALYEACLQDYPENSIALYALKIV